MCDNFPCDTLTVTH